jgi:hypothetical protein
VDGQEVKEGKERLFVVRLMLNQITESRLAILVVVDEIAVAATGISLIL